MACEDDEEEEETKRMETSSLASEEEEELGKGLRAENRTSARQKRRKNDREGELQKR